jgi:hypothetical protein
MSFLTNDLYIGSHRSNAHLQRCAFDCPRWRQRFSKWLSSRKFSTFALPRATKQVVSRLGTFVVCAQLNSGHSSDSLNSVCRGKFETPSVNCFFRHHRNPILSEDRWVDVYLSLPACCRLFGKNIYLMKVSTPIVRIEFSPTGEEEKQQPKQFSTRSSQKEGDMVTWKRIIFHIIYTWVFIVRRGL